MNVKKLREMLEGLDDNLEVVLAKDSEGNDFSPLADVDRGRYAPTQPWYGEFLADEYIGNGEYAQPGDEAVAAVCLWPTN